MISSEKTTGETIWFYLEYWIPGEISGQHIIKKAKVKIKVIGKDTTPPQVQWLQALTNDRIEARIYDGLSIDKAILRFMPNKEKSTIEYIDWEGVPEGFTVELVDNGLNGDAVKGDGIFSRKIENQPAYFYDLRLEMVDAVGNRQVIDWPETIFLRSTK